MALTNAQLLALIEANIPDNNVRFISPEKVREVMTSQNDSYLNLISNQNIIGLGEFDSAISYQMGVGVIESGNIYQALIQTSVGVFNPLEWEQISTFLDGDLNDYIKKDEGVELEAGKLTVTVATDSTITTLPTGFYKVEQNSSAVGETEQYPTTGQALLTVYRQVSQSQTVMMYYPLADLSQYFIRRENGIWLEYSNQVASVNDYSFVSEVNVGGIRIGDTVGPTFTDANNQLYSLPFVDMSFSYSINFSLVEKGLSVTPQSTWNISENDDTVTNVKLLRNNLLESDQGTTLSGNFTHPDSIAHTDSTLQRTYKIEIQSVDAVFKTSSKTVSFVAPTYSGVLDISNVDETNIKTLTKYIRNKATHNNVSFSPVLQRYIYAYPKSFGLLSSIKDPSNFEVIGSYDVSELTFTLADATTEDMYVYVSNADTTQTDFKQNFIY